MKKHDIQVHILCDFTSVNKQTTYNINVEYFGVF